MPVVVAKLYVEYQNDAYWVIDSQIPFKFVVYAFQNGIQYSGRPLF
ncbi:hypothetical protein [Nostoc sp. FACHB-888]|nr:hypothetical protein [Nostoc sp. FACHB-888]MBD2244751.1 hypothetical protein [Nostoc sp. FACHB-888]